MIVASDSRLDYVASVGWLKGTEALVDCMFSADLMVDDPYAMAHVLVERLGLPALRKTWTDPGKTFDDYVYLRAYHPYSPMSPTLLEIISSGHFHPHRDSRPAAVATQPAARPVKTHATVLITKHYKDLISHLQREGIRHYDMPDPGDGLARCWFGVDSLSASEPSANRYDPSADGGLFLEVISWEGTTLAVRDPIPVSAPEGTITRVVARTWLVPDVDATVASLRRSLLGWPGGDISTDEKAGSRFALLQPSMSTSAALELVSPTDKQGRHGAFFDRWGPGPHAIRLGVRGLDAKADDLRERGTPFRREEAPGGDPVLVVDGDALGGPIFEFAEEA